MCSAEYGLWATHFCKWLLSACTQWPCHRHGRDAMYSSHSCRRPGRHSAHKLRPPQLLPCSWPRCRCLRAGPWGHIPTFKFTLRRRNRICKESHIVTHCNVGTWQAEAGGLLEFEVRLHCRGKPCCETLLLAMSAPSKTRWRVAQG